MTVLTPNIQLKEYDRTTDKTANFIDFRDDLAGTASTSNMSKIDAFAGETTNAITNLKGTGYTNQTVKGNYDLITQVNSRVTYTVPVTGTNTLVGTVAQITTPLNDSILKIIPSVTNTGSVTLNINNTGAVPITVVQNWTGSTVYAPLKAGDLTPNQQYIITKSPDGVRYIILGLENSAVNSYYKNTDNTYTNLQDKLTVIDNNINPQIQKTQALSFAQTSITSVKDNDITCNADITPTHQLTVGNELQTTINPTIKITHADTTITETVCEGEFLTGDLPKIENGVLRGQKLWEKRILFGKDYPFEWYQDFVGFKEFKISLNQFIGTQTGVVGNYLTNQNQVILTETLSNVANSFCMESDGLYLQISDSLTGFTESINPNADEIKAFMNGWKATANNGTRYTAWVSVVDGTTAPTVQSIDFVKFNLASKYEGYKLYYKLSTPKELNQSLDNPPVLKKGVNTVVMDTGQVRGEVARPSYSAVWGKWYINSIGAGSHLAESKLINKAQLISSINKDGSPDIVNWTDESGTPTAYGFALYSSEYKFDPRATYTVDYTILRTIAPQIGSATLKYKEGIVDSINGIIEQLPSKQPQSDVLDRIVDLAEYEILGHPRYSLPTYWFIDSGVLYGRVQVYMNRKNKQPMIYSNVLKFIKGGVTVTDITNLCNLEGFYTTDNSVIVAFKISDTSTINDIKTFGMVSTVQLTADARY